jgi:hypothetical protein
MRRVLIVLGFVLLVGQPLYAQETIGPFDIEQAPESATGSVGATWGNVVNTPVTVNEAFSGFSIIDDGFINISAGDFYEVTFNPPVVNVTGPDIVVFDARYDAGAYTLRTSYDGFSASFVPSSWVDSGVDQSYYYGGASPASADVWGVEVDLSDLGVPDSASVSNIRVTANNGAGDPLGVGALGEPLIQAANVPIPTLSSAGMIVLVLTMTGIAVLLIRRRIA